MQLSTNSFNLSLFVFDLTNNSLKTFEVIIGSNMSCDKHLPEQIVLLLEISIKSPPKSVHWHYRMTANKAHFPLLRNSHNWRMLGNIIVNSRSMAQALNPF